MHEAAVWKRRLVFLRRDPTGGREDPFQPGRRPDRLFAWQIGSRVSQPVKLPRSTGVHNADISWPAGLTGVINGLTLNAQQLAYTTSVQVGTFGLSSLWFQQLGHGPELIDQRTGGAGDVCPGLFLSPVLADGWLYAYLHACDPSDNSRLDRLTRHRVGKVQRVYSSFLQLGDGEVFSVVPDRGGVLWDNGEVQALTSVTWRKIPPPAPATFCGRAALFC